MREKLDFSEHKSSLLDTKIVEDKKEIFWSFTNNTKYDFMKLVFQSKEGYHLYNSFFKYNRHFPGVSDYKKKPHHLEFKLFEANLPLRGLQPISMSRFRLKPLYFST